jgi:hypothetical protein
MTGRVEDINGSLFVSPDGRVRLLEIKLHVTGKDDAPRALVNDIDQGLTDGKGAPRVSGDKLVSQLVDDRLERRTLYAADAKNDVFMYSAACIGPAAARAQCVRALATMRLSVPDEVPPNATGWDRDRHDSAFAQLLRLLLVVVVPLGVLLWIVKKLYRPRRPPRVAAIPPGPPSPPAAE